MPRGRKRASRSDDYASDHGFIANGSDVDDAPRTKKSKTAAARSKALGASSVDEQTWELSDRRRVQVSEFKGRPLIGIREYYEKDGEMLPGKKGISLTIDQYNNLILALPDIEAALSAKGENVRRPDYKGTATPALKEESGSLADETKQEAETTGKRNFEATSEEE